MRSNRLPVLLLAAASLLGFALDGRAESTGRGREVFVKDGCQYCHAHASRRRGPAVRDMADRFWGDPVAAATAFKAVGRHQDDARTKALSESDLRVIAVWLADEEWPEEAHREATGEVAEPVAASPAAEAAAAESAAPESTAPESTAAAAAAPPKPPAVTVGAIRLQKGARGSERLVLEIAKGELNRVDLKSAGGQLVVTMEDTGLAGSLPPAIEGISGSRLVRSVQVQRGDGALVLTITPGVGDWTYTGFQGHSRFTIDLAEAVAKAGPTAVAKAAPAVSPGKPPGMPGRVAPREDKAGAAPKPPATAMAVAPAAERAGREPAQRTEADSRMLAQHEAEARAKRDAEAQAKREAAVQAKRDAAVQAKRDAEAQAKRDAEAQAKRDAAVQAKREAEAQAKREAEAQAKREAEAQAKREAEAQAKREAEAQAKREAEAQAKRDAEAKQQLAMAAPPEKAAGDGGDRASRREALAREHKDVKLEPCPEYSPAEQVIGEVDVDRAKEIIDRVGCPQCHAYVQKKTGPPFKKVLQKYKGNPACVVFRLKTNKTHNDEGVTKDIRPDEFRVLADYVASRFK